MTARDEILRLGQAAGRAAGRLSDAQHAASASLRRSAPSRGVLDRLLHALGDALSFAVPGGGAGTLPTVIVLAALACGAGLLLVRSRRGPVAVVIAAEPRAAEPLAFAAARRRAEVLADSDPRAALRLLYAALVRELGRRGGRAARPGLSNWAHVRRLGVDTTEGAALAECTQVFEQRVYGRVAAEAGDVRRVDELATVVLGCATE